MMTSQSGDYLSQLMNPFAKASSCFSEGDEPIRLAVKLSKMY